MSDFLSRWASEFWTISLESGLWLVVGFLLAGFVHTLIPRAWMAKHLSGRGPWPIAKASLLGIPLPLCSCSVIPVAAGLRASGASRGSSAAFIISTPQTGEESIPLTWALFGPVFALIRPVIAVATAFTAGLLIETLTPEPPPAKPDQPDPSPKKSCCSSTPAQTPAQTCCNSDPAPAAPTSTCCASTPDAPGAKSIGARIIESLRWGLIDMPKDLAPWLLVGLGVAALIAALVPEGWIESNIGTGLVPMLLMLLVGLPLYICATSSTPVAFTLVAAGLSPGAALVLLLAGPATNAATMAWVIKDLGGRALVIYLVVIAAFSVASGVAFDTFLSAFVSLAQNALDHDHHTPSLLQIISAVAMLTMLALALVLRYAPRRSAG